MSRIRTIKPDFFLHEGLFDAERESRLPIRVAFAGLWTQADREGRFAWRPRRLKAAILPYDKVDFANVLEVLADKGFVAKYHLNGEDFGCIPSWLTHQRPNHREAASSLPEPDLSRADPGRPGQASGEGKGKEGKGREGEEQSSAAAGRLVLNLWNEHRGELRKARRESPERLQKCAALLKDCQGDLGLVEAMVRALAADSFHRERRTEIDTFLRPSHRAKYIDNGLEWLDKQKAQARPRCDLDTKAKPGESRWETFYRLKGERG